MKRFLLLILLFATVGMANANPVDQASAQAVGANFLKASANLNITSNDLQLVTTYNLNDGDVAFYVFGSENGFVIVSAMDYAYPILGYSDEGPFSLNNIPVQMEEYLQGFVEQIQYGKNNNLTADEETALQWQLVSTTGRINEDRNANAVSPLLPATWGQGDENASYNIYRRYNIMCPADASGPNGHALTGCVATAMGQIMHYWNYPTTGNGSHTYTPSGYPTQTANFGATTYDWANMPNQLSSSSTTTQNNAVATLLWHCGVSVDMNYGPDGSGANSGNVPASLQNYFRYSNELYGVYKSNYASSTWISMLKSNLNSGMPVYYTGHNSSGGNGHAFVCDGYNSSDQFHFNWGWDGAANNYFALNALNAGGYDFSYYNYAVFSIHPIVNPNVTYQVSATASPTSGGTVTGGGSYSQYQTCTLTATAASGFNFLGWKENNVIVSTENTLSFVVRQNRNLVAVFSLPEIASVSANYYPDANNPESPYVEVTWQGCVTHTESFENGIPSDWTVIDGNNDGYTWTAVSDVPTTWTYYAGNTLDWYRTGSNAVVSGSYINGVGALSPNEYLVTPPISVSGGSTFSFWAAACDPNYPADHFGVGVSTTTPTASAFTMIQEWTMTAKNGGLSGGRTSREGDGAKIGAWYNYTVDLSAYAGQQVYVAIRHFNCNDQYIISVDDVEYSTGGSPTPPTPPSGTTYNFDDGTMNGWTSIDGDGDGNGWVSSASPGIYHNSGVNLSGTGHNASEAYVISGSYANQTGQALTPNNFLVCPTKAAYNSISFYACAQDVNYPAEHFGVAVSTTGNTNASSFTTLQEWTLTAKGSGTTTNGREGETRDQTTWQQFTVDLSAYAGQQIWVAIRHFNCTDQFILNVDDITLSTSSKGTLDNTQIVSYKVYRTDCGNNGPYTPSNTTTLATQQTGTSYIDQTWNNVSFGSYKFGVSAVSINNTESSIVWSSCLSNGVGYTINATANPSAGGTVSGSGLYEQNTTCTLTATANTGYTFVNWTKNGSIVSTNATYSFTVTENATYVANFNVTSYTVTANANPAAGGNVSGAGTYNHGVTCTLTATANAGYEFVNWTKNGSAVSTNASYSFTVTESASYTANFSLITYTITVAADPTNGGTVTGGGTFAQGETCTITATANNNYNFINWTKNGTVVSANPVYTFTVNSNGNYVAHFSQDIYYTVVATANPEEGGTVTGSGTFSAGETCTLTATANTGFTFMNWTKNGTIVSTNSTYSFTVNETAEYIANFNHNTYTVTAVADPGNGGTVTGAGTYNYGETATITVTPNTNFVFDGWYENGSLISDKMSFSVMVTENHNFVATLHFYDNVGEQNDNMFVLYPNPVGDKLTVNSREFVRRCDVYSVSGQLVFSMTECSEVFEIDVTSLPEGTYIIRMISDKEVATQRFVKK